MYNHITELKKKYPEIKVTITTKLAYNKYIGSINIKHPLNTTMRCLLNKKKHLIMTPDIVYKAATKCEYEFLKQVYYDNDFSSLSKIIQKFIDTNAALLKNYRSTLIYFSTLEEADEWINFFNKLQYKNNLVTQINIIKDLTLEADTMILSAPHLKKYNYKMYFKTNSKYGTTEEVYNTIKQFAESYNSNVQFCFYLVQMISKPFITTYTYNDYIYATSEDYIMIFKMLLPQYCGKILKIKHV